jgi:hypothetical protein
MTLDRMSTERHPVQFNVHVIKSIYISFSYTKNLVTKRKFATVERTCPTDGGISRDGADERIT